MKLDKVTVFIIMAKFTLEPLSKDNFDSWGMQMEALLIKTDGWPYVEGTILKPEPGVKKTLGSIWTHFSVPSTI